MPTCLALLALLGSAPAFAGFTQRDFAETNPRTYVSPSDSHSLKVDPSNRYGAGGATYTLSKGKGTIYSLKLPFTLWDAAVADNGVAIGYAYSSGYEGFGPNLEERSRGTLSLILLGSDGTPTTLKTFTRSDSRYLHTPPYPLGLGVLLDPDNGRAVFRLELEDGYGKAETWQVYRLSTHEKMLEAKPYDLMWPPESVRFLIAARLVPGTRLTLLHWWTAGNSGQLGARFTLIDESLKPVWTLDLPDDYSIPKNEDAQDRLVDQVRRYGAILKTGPNSFELRFAKANQRVAFGVNRPRDGQWVVHETGRSPYSVAKQKPPAEAKIPERKLKSLGTVTLQAPSVTSERLSVMGDIGPAGKGRFAYLALSDGGKAFLAVVSEDGRHLRRVSLAKIPRDPDHATLSGCVWLGGERFLVTLTQYDTKDRTRCWKVDAASGAVSEIKGISLPYVEKLAPCPDGGFVALATTHTKYSMTTGVYAFGPDLKLRWHREEPMGMGPNDPPETLVSPEDIAVTPDGRVAVIDVIAHVIQVFDRNGKFQSRIDLDKTWGAEASYPCQIAASNTEFAVYDQGEGIYRLDTKGRKLATLKTRFADGRKFDSRFGLALGSDGRIWTTDGDVLVRMTDKGVADRVAGTAPKTDRLERIIGFEVGPNGRLYAQDERSGAVHVFDVSGKPMLIMKPTLEDCSATGPPGPMQVLPDGEVFLWGAFVGDECGWLHFSSDGKRLGIQLEQEQKVSPGGAVGFRWGHQSLLDKDGHVLAKIERSGDGKFLQYGGETAATQDLRLALLSGVSWRAQSTSRTVSLYEPSGAPVRWFELRPNLRSARLFAYDGNLVFLLCDERIVCLDSFGKPLWGFRPPMPKGHRVRWAQLTLDGRFLLVMPESGKTLYRYAVP